MKAVEKLVRAFDSKDFSGVDIYPNISINFLQEAQSTQLFKYVFKHPVTTESFQFISYIQDKLLSLQMFDELNFFYNLLQQINIQNHIQPESYNFYYVFMHSSFGFNFVLSHNLLPILVRDSRFLSFFTPENDSAPLQNSFQCLNINDQFKVIEYVQQTNSNSYQELMNKTNIQKLEKEAQIKLLTHLPNFPERQKEISQFAVFERILEKGFDCKLMYHCVRLLPQNEIIKFERFINCKNYNLMILDSCYVYGEEQIYAIAFLHELCAKGGEETKQRLKAINKRKMLIFNIFSTEFIQEYAKALETVTIHNHSRKNKVADKNYVTQYRFQKQILKFSPISQQIIEKFNISPEVQELILNEIQNTKTDLQQTNINQTIIGIEILTQFLIILFDDSQIIMQSLIVLPRFKINPNESGSNNLKRFINSCIDNDMRIEQIDQILQFKNESPTKKSFLQLESTNHIISKSFLKDPSIQEQSRVCRSINNGSKIQQQSLNNKEKENYSAKIVDIVNYINQNFYNVTVNLSEIFSTNNEIGEQLYFTRQAYNHQKESDALNTIIKDLNNLQIQIQRILSVTTSDKEEYICQINLYIIQQILHVLSRFRMYIAGTRTHQNVIDLKSYSKTQYNELIWNENSLPKEKQMAEEQNRICLIALLKYFKLKNNEIVGVLDFIIIGQILHYIIEKGMIIEDNQIKFYNQELNCMFDSIQNFNSVKQPVQATKQDNPLLTKSDLQTPIIIQPVQSQQNKNIYKQQISNIYDTITNRQNVSDPVVSVVNKTLEPKNNQKIKSANSFCQTEQIKFNKQNLTVQQQTNTNQVESNNQQNVTLQQVVKPLENQNQSNIQQINQNINTNLQKDINQQETNCLNTTENVYNTYDTDNLNKQLTSIFIPQPEVQVQNIVVNKAKTHMNKNNQQEVPQVIVAKPPNFEKAKLLNKPRSDLIPDVPISSTPDQQPLNQAGLFQEVIDLGLYRDQIGWVDRIDTPSQHSPKKSLRTENEDRITMSPRRKDQIQREGNTNLETLKQLLKQSTQKLQTQRSERVISFDQSTDQQNSNQQPSIYRRPLPVGKVTNREVLDLDLDQLNEQEMEFEVNIYRPKNSKFLTEGHLKREIKAQNVKNETNGQSKLDLLKQKEIDEVKKEVKVGEIGTPSIYKQKVPSFKV
ncbi:Hypothetical_protein [Hexamita inflata]|uniref:Hypothetical_protein n=1 Tax=Hexamita inflata TaxID=28002 RepID=A0AA86Q3R3_9EUKA|nr:Hypothetical protein HINF_LOCUS38338 [Hexamita inflata]